MRYFVNQLKVDLIFHSDHIFWLQSISSFQVIIGWDRYLDKHDIFCQSNTKLIWYLSLQIISFGYNQTRLMIIMMLILSLSLSSKNIYTCVSHSLTHSFHRYASLYFCCCVEQDDNELLTLEIIHRYVELLDKYFGSVSVSL